jgi:hypothetical protein
MHAGTDAGCPAIAHNNGVLGSTPRLATNLEAKVVVEPGLQDPIVT